MRLTNRGILFVSLLAALALPPAVDFSEQVWEANQDI